MVAYSSTLTILAYITSYLNQCPLSDPVNYQTKCVPNSDHIYDFIIVGAGSAGSTLAARLSDNPQWKVLLIEAGGVPSNLSEAPGVFIALQKTSEDWQFKTEPGNHCLGFTNGRCNWPQGKALGRGSTINSMLAAPGDSHNFKEWAKMGNTRWNWEAVKPYFDKAFKQMNTTKYESALPTRTLLLEAANHLGFGVNTPNLKIGYQDVNMTINAHQRNNVAKAYLALARKRSNLCIMTNSQVEKIIFKGKKAVGVQLKNSKVYARKEVIISAGAINTPKLLMLSGVGSKRQLRKHNIPVVKQLPGVGLNLMDHLLFANYIKLPGLLIEKNGTDFLKPYCDARKGPMGEVDIINVVGWINTDNNTEYSNVQYMHLTSAKNNQFVLSDWLDKMAYNSISAESIRKENEKATLLLTTTILSRPKSRGHVFLASNNIRDAPLIHPRYLSHPDDMNVMLNGIKHVNRMINTPKFAEVGAEILNFDIPNCNHLEFNTDPFWRCSLRNIGSTVNHPTGTCKMGQGDDKLAVVDEDLRIHRLENIRVVDSSIMPKITTGNTNIPVIAIAEKAADIIKTFYQNPINFCTADLCMSSVQR